MEDRLNASPYEGTMNSGKRDSNLLFQFMKCSWFWSVYLPFGPPLQKDHIQQDQDFTETRPLVLNAQSPYQETACHRMHKQEEQNVEALHLAWIAVLHTCPNEKQCATWNYHLRTVKSLSIAPTHHFPASMFISSHAKDIARKKQGMMDSGFTVFTFHSTCTINTNQIQHLYFSEISLWLYRAVHHKGGHTTVLAGSCWPLTMAA